MTNMLDYTLTDYKHSPISRVQPNVCPGVMSIVVMYKRPHLEGIHSAQLSVAAEELEKTVFADPYGGVLIREDDRSRN